MDKFQTILQDIGLYIALLIGGVITWLKLQDDESIKLLTRGAKLRKMIIGCVGSCIAVLLVYEAAIAFGVSPRFATALAALFGYIGGDITIKLVLSYVEKYTDKILESIGKKD